MEGRMLYGVTVSDTIKRGNADEIQSVLKQAKETLAAQGDLGQAIKDLEAAIGGGYGGGHARPLYGVTVHDTIKRGNKGEIEKLLNEAKDTHSKQGDLGQAIKDLESALKK